MFHIKNYLFVFCLQYMLIALIILNMVCGQFLKTIPVKIYISPAGRSEFFNHGVVFEEMAREVILKLETVLNLALLMPPPSIVIKYEPIFETEVPADVELDRCNTNLIEIGSMLNAFNVDNSATSTIVFINCKAMAYTEAFRKVGLRVPYITNMLSSQCTTRTAIFVETEKPKFLSVFATALVKAAGIPLLNSLSFEEVPSGDKGVRYEIRVGVDTITQFKENKCFYTSEANDAPPLD